MKFTRCLAMVVAIVVSMPVFSACPDPSSIKATKAEKDTDGVTSMVYCSADGKKACGWKGFDAFAHQGSKVKSLAQESNQNGNVYCDYELESGAQIRMARQKK